MLRPLAAVVMTSLLTAGLLTDRHETPAAGVTVDAICGNSRTNEVSCPLMIGEQTYRLDSGLTQYLKLTNTTDRPLQIDAVQGAAAGRGREFLEYCIGRNRFETGQSVAGEGEAACTSRNSGVAISGIRLRASPTDPGLTVDPGDTIYVSFNPMPTEPWFTVTVTSSRATGQLATWRQPMVDQIIHCNGQVQQTRWSPWVNQTGRSLSLTGAILYAQGGEPPVDQVDTACVYILNIRGQVRYRMCEGVNARNPSGLLIRAQTVAPGESVAGQASNTCHAPAVWGWAAYMLIRD